MTGISMTGAVLSRFRPWSRLGAGLLGLSALCLTLPGGAGAQAAPDGPAAAADSPAPQPEARPPYGLLRQEEDWSFLGRAAPKPGAKADFWDGVKFIPLGPPGSRRFLTLGGQERLFYEYLGNEGWGASPFGSNSYLLNRTMLSADLHLDAARVFVELKTGTVAGRKGGARRGLDSDDADFNQGFLELASRPFAENTPPEYTLRAGRQELQFGAGRQVSVREGPNVRQGFDGIFGIYRPPGRRNLRVDAWTSRPVRIRPRAFDDGADPSQSLSGIYAAQSLGGARTLDLYYLNKTQRGSVYFQGQGGEQRHTVGFRLASTPGPENTRPVDYDFEPSFQFGKFAGSRIEAWSVSFSAGYTLPRSPQHLRLGLLGGLNSGDRNPGDRTLQTFQPPAPSGRYFGQIPLFGPQNVNGFAPTATFSPAKPVTVTLYSYFFWRQSLQDGIYALPGGLLRPGPTGAGAASGARYIGAQPELNLGWQIDPHTSLTVDYAEFFSGPFLHQAPPGKNIRYFGGWVTYLF